MFCDAAIGFSSRGIYASVTAAIVAHTDLLFRIIDLMSDSTEGASASNAEEVGVNPPHPDDLRNVILGRPRVPIEPVSDGEFSAEAKPEDEPAWVDAASGAPSSDEPAWREVAYDEPEPRADREYQHPPFYTEFEAETDRGHPETVARFGPPAGFGRRVIAYLIDNAVTIVILSLLFPFVLGRPYIDVEAITSELDAASQEVLPTATPVLGTNGGPSLSGSTQTELEEESIAEIFSGLLLAFVVTTVYNGLLVGMFGTTIGKRLLNVYVLDANGDIPGIPLAFGRALATIVSTAIFYVGYLFILRNDNRALHDQMVGTYAVTLTTGEHPTHRVEQSAD